MVMRRILGLERKNRKQLFPRVEIEIAEAIKINGLDLSDTCNIALEKHLADKGIQVG